MSVVVDRYSVGEVEAAFAAQGIRLHKAPIQNVPNSVLLWDASEPSEVTVQPVVFHPAGGSAFAFASVKKGGQLHVARHGNVVVAFKAGSAAVVKAALARLN